MLKSPRDNYSSGVSSAAKHRRTARGLVAFALSVVTITMAVTLYRHDKNSTDWAQRQKRL